MRVFVTAWPDLYCPGCCTGPRLRRVDRAPLNVGVGETLVAQPDQQQSPSVHERNHATGAPCMPDIAAVGPRPRANPQRARLCTAAGPSPRLGRLIGRRASKAELVWADVIRQRRDRRGGGAVSTRSMALPSTGNVADDGGSTSCFPAARVNSRAPGLVLSTGGQHGQFPG
jgi:hypothetical protein